MDMADFSLRCEMHSIILRGFQKLRDIEFLQHARETLVLEARMLLAATDDIDDDAPTPEEIAAACEAIKAEWSDRVLEERRWFDPHKLDNDREYHTEWREENRDHLREYHRARKDHNKALRQSRSEERKAELLAYRRALYAKHAEQRREQNKAFREANRDRMNARRRELRSRAAACC